MIAVISTPSSLIELRPIRLTVNTSAPNWRSCTAPCWAMTIPTRKLIRPMIPKAWTPTTSKRWTTALSRKRRGWRMTLPIEISIAPKKPSRPTKVRPASIVASPSWVEHPLERRRRIGADLDRLVGALDLAEQGRCALVGADDLAAAVARGAVDEPGADRVHPADPGKVDDEVAALQPVEPVGQHSEPRQGQVALEAEHAAAFLDAVGEAGDRAHAARSCFNSPARATTGQRPGPDA